MLFMADSVRVSPFAKQVNMHTSRFWMAYPATLHQVHWASRAGLRWKTLCLQKKKKKSTATGKETGILLVGMSCCAPPSVALWRPTFWMERREEKIRRQVIFSSLGLFCDQNLVVLYFSRVCKQLGKVHCILGVTEVINADNCTF